MNRVMRAAAYLRLLFLILVLPLAMPAGAAENDAGNEVEAALAALDKAKVAGPTSIPVREQGTLKLPRGYYFVPRPTADQVMRAFGNQVDERFVGLIISAKEDDQWMATVDFEKSGYIKDDDAKDWNVDDLYGSLKEGTEAANKERAKRGMPELELAGWVEKPAYDAASHQLIWSMAARHKGDPANAGQSVNYNTYVLGREGYISLNFITGRDKIEAEKPMARELLSALTFVPGKTYADFNPSSDKMAEYGLAALVGGVAAKKLGLLAIIAAFVAKSFKLILVAVVAFGAGIKKFFFGKKDEA